MADSNALYQSSTPLDPAESLMAITGVGLLTGERQASISTEEIRRAANLADTVEAKAKSCFNQSLDVRAPAPINFKRSLKRLSALQGHSDHVDRMEKMPPGFTKLGITYNILLHNLQGEIMKMLPVQTWQSIGGTETAPPSDLKFWKFLSILQVIDEPLTVFRLIANGQLLKKQALAVKTIYPTLSERITTALVSCWISHKAKQADYRPNWILNKGLAAWFEGSPIPPDMLRRCQQMHIMANAAAEQAKGQQPPPEPPGQSTASPSQRAQYGQIQ